MFTYFMQEKQTDVGFKLQMLLLPVSRYTFEYLTFKSHTNQKIQADGRWK